jgi:hypothetical protein
MRLSSLWPSLGLLTFLSKAQFVHSSSVCFLVYQVCQSRISVNANGTPVLVAEDDIAETKKSASGGANSSFSLCFAILLSTVALCSVYFAFV